MSLACFCQFMRFDDDEVDLLTSRSVIQVPTPLMEAILLKLCEPVFREQLLCQG